MAIRFMEDDLYSEFYEASKGLLEEYVADVRERLETDPLKSEAFAQFREQMRKSGLSRVGEATLYFCRLSREFAFWVAFAAEETIAGLFVCALHQLAATERALG